jgi:hypothetical protein
MNGNEFWFNDEMTELHRDNGPAVIYAEDNSEQEYWEGYKVIYSCPDHRKVNATTGKVVFAELLYNSDTVGIKTWYKNRLCHRENGPAQEQLNGYKVWCREGLMHNDSGPAILTHNGVKEWFQKGLNHRDDGPAIIYADGTQVWYNHGDIHNENGAAIIHANGQEEYWENGKPMVSKTFTFDKDTRKLKFVPSKQIRKFFEDANAQTSISAKPITFKEQFALLWKYNRKALIVAVLATIAYFALFILALLTFK